MYITKMQKKLGFILLAIVIIRVSTTEAKGGRGGGGRSGGRSSGGSRSSWSSSSTNSKSNGGSGWSIFRSGSKSDSSGNGASKSFSSTHIQPQNSGGWFHGFFHSTPYHYTYRPTYISRGSYATDTQQQTSYNDVQEKYPYSDDTGYYAFGQNPNKDNGNNLNKQGDLNKDDRDYAIGYTISKALSGDFFSIFNVVHDISKYPEKIKNKELVPPTIPSTITTTSTTTTTTTTTEIPVTANDIDSYINKPYTSWEKNSENTRSKLFDMIENVGSVTTTESTAPTYDFSNSEIFNTNRNFGMNTGSVDDYKKTVDDLLSSISLGEKLINQMQAIEYQLKINESMYM